MPERLCLAADIGGSSIKLLTARYTGGQIEILDQYSVPTRPISGGGHLRIDISAFMEALLEGLERAAANCRLPQTLGIDTFGNGYGYLDHGLNLLELPYFYKDPRTQGVLAEMDQAVPLYEVYQSSGLYPTDIRVLMQLFYDSRQPDSPLHRCQWLLLLPGLLHFLLTGYLQAEESMASVANLLDLTGTAWNLSLLKRLGIPTDILPPLVPGGKTLRPLRPELAQRVGGKVQLVSVTTHDTESALLAAPELEAGRLFASIGTSVIFGVRTTAPIVSRQGYAGAFKNIKGPFHYSLCRDFNAMWLFEQCMADWRRENPALAYRDVDEACLTARENRSYLNVCDPFLRTEHPSMPAAIQEYCRTTGQAVPKTPGEIAACVFDSIVLQALWSFRQIQQITGQAACAGLTAVGGGIKNHRLIQHMADALEVPVTTGSEVSSALGNVLMQLHATGELTDGASIRQTAQRSITSRVFRPHPSPKWEKALLVLDRIDQMRGIWR